MSQPLVKLAGLILTSISAFSQSGVSGRVLDPQGAAVPGATVRLETGEGYRLSARSDTEGRYRFGSIPNGEYHLRAEAPGLASTDLSLTLAGRLAIQDVTLSQLAVRRQSIVITAQTVEPELDLRNAAVFNRTLFTRDDQV